jgi:hypothetical protein
MLINSRHTWYIYVLDRKSGIVSHTVDGYEHGLSWPLGTSRESA